MFCFYSCYLWDCGEHMGTMYRCPFHTVPMINLSLSCFLVNVKLLNNKTNKSKTCVICSSDLLPWFQRVWRSKRGHNSCTTMKKWQFSNGRRPRLMISLILWKVSICAIWPGGWQYVLLHLAWACWKTWESGEVAGIWRYRGE